MSNIIQAFPAGAGSGHTILDGDGTVIAQEKNLKITGLSVTDSPSTESTDLAPAGLNQDSIDDIAAVGLPSSNIVGSGLNYSEAEQIVGRWINGKPLYQKTIVISNCSANTWNTTPHNASNVDDVVEETAMVKCTNGTIYGIGYRTTEVCGMMQATATTVGCYLGTHSVYNGATVTITIKYTKTTD